MDRRPTIKDVARAAGVSKSTVSLVLQNNPAVKAETRVSVQKAMARIGYVYNRAAATLRSSNTGLIGLIINDLRNPFFTEFAISLQMALSNRHYAAVVANTDEDPDLQLQMVEAMIQHGVDAFVISPAYGREDETFDAIARAGIPTMQVLRRVVDDTGAFPFAAPDYYAGSQLATRHLIDKGCRRIAYVGGLEGRAVTRERMSGYLDALRDAGIEPRHFPGRPSRAFGRETLLQLRQQDPDIDGVLCFNDLTALGLLAGCNQSGLVAGRGFRVVGFDDIEECADSYPGLSTVSCDIANFGENIASGLLDWLTDNKAPQPETRTPVHLVIRDTSK